jgi:thioredoxin reductase (NADPH)
MTEIVSHPAGKAERLFDLLVIGAGPNGLSCAIEAQKAGLSAVVIDKGCICNSLFHYPSQMTFFTTAELLEIGGIPFSSPNAKPTRAEALQYYRRVAAYFRLDIRQYHRVERVSGTNGNFTVHTLDNFGRAKLIRARKIAVAIGYFDMPNQLGIPGETLSKVHHYYFDPHPFSDSDVVVVGGKNSAAIAALELWRAGARVTLVHRGSQLRDHIKYWIKPDLENRIKAGEIKAFFSSKLTGIAPNTVTLASPDGERTLPNNFVFAMTGYHPDFRFLESLGITFNGEDRLPVLNCETLESNVAGIHLAGVIVAGARTNDIFIENGRFHGVRIAAAIRPR